MRVVLFIACCVVGSRFCQGQVPTTDEVMVKLEGAFKAFESYEVEYEVTKQVAFVDRPVMARMLWRASRDAMYVQPLSAPPSIVGNPPCAELRSVKSVTATEERTLLLGSATSFKPEGRNSYVAFVRTLTAPDTRPDSGIDARLNPILLMFPRPNLLSAREHVVVLHGPVNVGGRGQINWFLPYRAESDPHFVVRAGTPVLHVKVEKGSWYAGRFRPAELAVELWLDPAAGWMPRERMEYVDGRPLVSIEVTGYSQVNGVWFPKGGTRTTYDATQPGIASSTWTYKVIRFEKKTFSASDLEVDTSQAAYTFDSAGKRVMNPAYWTSRLDEVEAELNKAGDLNQP